MEHRVRQVIALAEQTLHRGWSPAKLAALVNLSPSRLHQLFKEETGVPPARYLRQLRMRRATELLETTHLSVKQVMAVVGLSDESHFVRDFKKTCGLTPARYRERCLGGAVLKTIQMIVNITDASCDILHLELGPLDLELLGLEVHLNRIVLDIDADPTGGLLGALLCAVANLLDVGGPLADIVGLLDQILALL